VTRSTSHFSQGVEVVNGSAVHQGSRSERSTFTLTNKNKHTSPTNKVYFHTQINNRSEQVEGQQGPEADQPTQEVVEVVE